MRRIEVSLRELVVVRRWVFGLSYAGHSGPRGPSEGPISSRQTRGLDTSSLSQVYPRPGSRRVGKRLVLLRHDVPGRLLVVHTCTRPFSLLPSVISLPPHCQQGWVPLSVYDIPYGPCRTQTNVSPGLLVRETWIPPGPSISV